METDKPEQEAKEKLTLSEWMSGLLAVALILFGYVQIFGLLWSLMPDGAKYSAVYAVEYDVNYSDVHVEMRPRNCDWIHAPIGDKACHYSQHAYPLRNDSEHVMSVQVGWDKIQY